MFIVLVSALIFLVFADFNNIQNINNGHGCPTPLNITNDPDSTTTESAPKRQCFIRSTCQGQVVDHQKVQNKSACFSLCKSNSECEWATFDFVYHFCTHFSTCPSIDYSSCESCITSAKNCPLELTQENPCDVQGRCKVQNKSAI